MMENLPQRDRRQKRRFLTLRNVSIAVLVACVAFAGFSLWREYNPRSDDGSALLETRRQKVEQLVVPESMPYTDTGEVSEHDPSEPLWTERPNQEEILGVDPYDQYRQPEEIAVSNTTADPEPALSFRGSGEPFLEQRSDRDDARIKISGAGSDLRIEKPDGN